MLSFNDLPPEIIKKIFLNIKIKKLRKLKLICSYWYTIIEEIINLFLNIEIEELEVDNKRFQEALNIYERWIGSCSFNLYYSKSGSLDKIYDQEFANKKIDFFKSIGSGYSHKVSRKIYDIRRIFNYIEILNKLKEDTNCSAWYYDVLRYKPDGYNPDEALWSTIIAITGSDISLKELKNKCYEDKFIQNFMEKYKWYCFENQEIKDEGTCYHVSIITVYPDNKTFSILYAIDSL